MDLQLEIGGVCIVINCDFGFMIVGICYGIENVVCVEVDVFYDCVEDMMWFMGQCQVDDGVV